MVHPLKAEEDWFNDAVVVAGGAVVLNVELA